MSNPYNIVVDGKKGGVRSMPHLAAGAFPISETRGVIISDTLSTFEEIPSHFMTEPALNPILDAA